MPGAKPSDVNHHALRAPAGTRPGWRAGLVLAIWLVGTVWGLWHLAPELPPGASAVCRTARP